MEQIDRVREAFALQHKQTAFMTRAQGYCISTGSAVGSKQWGGENRCECASCRAFRHGHDMPHVANALAAGMSRISAPVAIPVVTTPLPHYDYSIKICPDLDKPDPDRDAGHSFGALSERCLDCGMGLSQYADTGSKCAGKPNLPARYAAFRETVERVVREEAPNVAVITDWSRNEGQVWLELGTVSFAFQLELDGGPYDGDVRNMLQDFSGQLGTQALGAK